MHEPTYCDAVYQLPPPTEAEIELTRIFGPSAYDQPRNCIRRPGHAGSHISQARAPLDVDDLFITVWDDQQLITVAINDAGQVICWDDNPTYEAP